MSGQHPTIYKSSTEKVQLLTNMNIINSLFQSGVLLVDSDRGWDKVMEQMVRQQELYEPMVAFGR